MSDAIGAAIQGPRADYLCEKCHEAGTMPEPVELSVNAKFCPLCGKKKWLVRIWSPPRLSTTDGRNGIKANELLGAAGYDEQVSKKNASWRKRSPSLYPLARLVNPNRLSTVLREMTGGQVSGIRGTTLAPGATTIESLRPIREAGGLAAHLTEPTPGPGSLRDRASKITR